jgi:hypothetical protein
MLSVVCTDVVLQMQIQDFNKGMYLGHSFVKNDDNNDNNTICPFRMCNIRCRGLTYRSPEEYVDCPDLVDGWMRSTVTLWGGVT